MGTEEKEMETLSRTSCNHLSHWWDVNDPQKQCPYCWYSPERHRGFFRSQLSNLWVFDEVMKEMRYESQLRSLPSSTRQTLPFHLDIDWNSDSGPSRMDHSCPCVMEGRLREECKDGCHQLRMYNEQCSKRRSKEEELVSFIGEEFLQMQNGLPIEEDQRDYEDDHSR